MYNVFFKSNCPTATQSDKVSEGRRASRLATILLILNTYERHVIFEEHCNYCSTFKLQLLGAALLGIFKIQKYLPPQAIKRKTPSVLK